MKKVITESLERVHTHTHTISLKNKKDKNGDRKDRNKSL